MPPPSNHILTHRTPDPEAVLERLHAAAEAMGRGMTQQDAARVLGWSVKTFSGRLKDLRSGRFERDVAEIMRVRRLIWTLYADGVSLFAIAFEAGLSKATVREIAAMGARAGVLTLRPRSFGRQRAPLKLPPKLQAEVKRPEIHTAAATLLGCKTRVLGDTRAGSAAFLASMAEAVIRFRAERGATA